MTCIAAPPPAAGDDDDDDDEGALYSVHVMHQRLIQPSEFRAVNGIITVH